MSALRHRQRKEKHATAASAGVSARDD